jgi:hypothetical protein
MTSSNADHITYENIIIGNFLVGFGLVASRHHANTNRPISDLYVNLLQQTPLDKRLGDLVLGCAGSMRILEFKRAQNKSDKEINKQKFLERYLDSPDCQHLKPVSRQIHWYVETQDDDAHLDASIVPYIEFPGNDKCCMSISAFIEETANQIFTENADGNMNIQHGEYLKMLWHRDSKPLDNDPTYGALIIQLSNGGPLQFAAIKDFRRLFMTPQDIESYGIRLGMTIRHELGMRYAIEQKYSLKYEQSLGRGFSYGRS